MAGLLITSATLPFEEYGHVILGGPGPALAYRVDQDRIRICLDVPSSVRPVANTARWIWEAFSELVPASLREGLRESLESTPVAWARNSFRPRSYEGAGVALIGDSAGFFHPLTAMGITMSLLDAESATLADALEHHSSRRARDSYVPELLSNAIYQAFARTDRGSLAIRASILRTWRKSPVQRARTMSLLAAATTSSAEFNRAFAAVAFDAAVEALTSDPRALPALAEWLRWPCATLCTDRGDVRSRTVSWAAPESWSSSEWLRALATSKGELHAN
jgi:2-polyprenyl-6-methoxyphenol hydroxylase-like FAD-dependent oxidoreductase